MKNLLIYIILFSFISAINIAGVMAREEEPADIYLEFSTWKNHDNSRSLMTKITSENEDGEYVVEGLTILFTLIGDQEDTVLGEAVSNEYGIAALNIADGMIDYPKDEEAYIYFTALFEGNDSYWEAEEELAVKDVSVSIRFEEEGDEKLVYFEGIIHGPEEEWPLADDELYFYVPRMFSDMKIAEGWFEEDGTGFIEFPTNVIGDSLGNVKVMARIEDHYDYGYVEVSGEINWAIPKKLIQAEGPARELWTPIAPLWMIITLIIMLAGVWGHYIYAVIQLIKIKRSKN
ncbi:MAG: hypothetical protein ABFS05_09135 [Bacteroidota bacterium]